MLARLPGVVARVNDDGTVHCGTVPRLKGVYGFEVRYGRRRPYSYFDSTEKSKLRVIWHGDVDEDTGEISRVKDWVVKDAEQAFDSIKAILNKARAKQ